MESTDFQDKAIQLVYVTPEGKYELHPDAENFLKQIPKPISIISVAGLYRTGKSYLLNRILLNRNNGFGVGPTINPFTKGLWCWGTPLKGTTKDGEKVNILIVDSEGIGALDEDQNHDIKIFTLAILTSSIFIYNSVGSIDQNALENLSLVVNLTKHIQLDSQKNGEDEDPEDLAEHFPTFFWVVRDFALQLISSEGENITPKEYLERALAPQKGFSDDIQEKNRIRRLLTSFFKERECATLVRPLVNEQKLQHLYNCSFDDLRPEFVEQALNLRKRIFHNTKAKTFKGQHLDGTMYLSILNSYLSCINNGAVPSIENAWTYMCMEKCQKLQQQCFNFFNHALENNIQCNLPCSSEDFEKEIQEIRNQCFEMFQREQIGPESKQYLSQLKEKIQQKINLIRLENERESINVLKNYIMKNFTVIEKKMRTNQYENFQDFLKSINSFYIHLLENGPDLPKKEIVYLDFLKKVITQAAQVFLKQSNQKLQTLKLTTTQKTNLLMTQNEELKNQIRIEIQKYQEEINATNSEKEKILRKVEKLESTLTETTNFFKTQLSELQLNSQEKSKALTLKISEIQCQNNQLKEAKCKLQSSFMLEKKQTEKEKALKQLKINQLRQQLKILKNKDKNQQIQLRDLNCEFNAKTKQMVIQHEKRESQLLLQLKNLGEKHAELFDKKENLQIHIKNMEKTYKDNLKFIQSELKQKTLAFQNYKLDFENDQLVKIKNLQEENSALKFEQTLFKETKMENERLLKETNEKFKTASHEYETEIAIINQKNDFLQQELLDLKESHAKSVNYYESLLSNKNKLLEQELLQNHKSQIEQLTQTFTIKIENLENENLISEQKIKNLLNTVNQLKLNAEFESDLITNKLKAQLTNKENCIKDLEQNKNKMQEQYERKMKTIQEESKEETLLLHNKVRQLEEELQTVMEKASSEQEQYNTKSEESLKQLKNYYQLEKQKLERRISLQKDKFQKKIEKVREDYEVQLQEERKTSEEQFETLKDELNNEVILLKDLVESLQHENDFKSRSLQLCEQQLSDLKKSQQKKELQFNSRFQSLTNTYNKDKQSFQVKITELSQSRTQYEKQILTIQYQKQEALKELKELTSKYNEKVQQRFSLNKKLEKLQNDHRQKLSQITSDFMSEKLNYEKKIALLQQEKEFYFKRLEQFESDQNKSSQHLEEKLKKMKQDFIEEHKEFENRKNSEYSQLEAKYQKLKKWAKENEQQMVKSITNLDKERIIEQEKYTNLQQKYSELETKKSEQGEQMSKQISQLKQSLNKLSKQSTDEIQKLKNQLSEVENSKSQITSSYEKSKILTTNKINFLEENKEKNKKQYLDKIRQLETTIENLQKVRVNDKTYYQNLISESTLKNERKYQAIIQQNQENWLKKEKELEGNLKQMTNQLRSLSEKNILENQLHQQAVKTLERKVREVQESEKRAQNDLEKYKQNREAITSDNINTLSKERQVMKSKLYDKQEKYKKLENAKQQLYYDFQKEKAKWNLEKDNYLMKNQELKEIIGKNERDIQKLTRENEKLKAEKKCSKMTNISSFSKYSVNSKFNLQDSINSINMSMSKENGNPLGEISFFNN